MTPSELAQVEADKAARLAQMQQVAPTKDELMAELAALTAKIQALS
jgi:hypothetical protein